MPLFLRKRAKDLREEMDDPDCDRGKLERTYAQFGTINILLSGWKRIFEQYIKPHCTDPGRTYTLLDIGFGGGDIPVLIHNLAQKNGIKLEITAIETDPRAISYVQGKSMPDSIIFRHTDEKSLIRENRTFDFIISNHLLHHLKTDEIRSILKNCEMLATGPVIFNDLIRSDAAWGLFNMLTLFAFRKSFIRTDGLRSIRRSYTRKELRSEIPDGWQVHAFFPFRMLLFRDFSRVTENHHVHA